MAGFGVLFTFITVGLALIIFAPLYAFSGYRIFRGKHYQGRQGALWGVAIPVLGGLIGIFPYFAGIFVSVPFNLQINIGVFVPLLSIPVGLIALVVMQIFAKPQPAPDTARSSVLP